MRIILTIAGTCVYWMMGLSYTFAVEINKYVPSCYLQASKPVAFSHYRKTDRLIISIAKEPSVHCYDNSLHITIENRSGLRLFYYHNKVSKLLADATRGNTKLSKKTLRRRIKQLKTSFSKARNFSSSRKLPRWMPEQDYYKKHFQILKVSKEYYHNLRNKNWVTYTHPTHQRGWQTVVFDQEKKKTVIVATGGM